MKILATLLAGALGCLFALVLLVTIAGGEGTKAAGDAAAAAGSCTAA